MKIVQMQTGLFPDAETVSSAVDTLTGTHDVARLDVTNLSEDDEDGWAAVAAEVLSADLVVTL